MIHKFLTTLSPPPFKTGLTTLKALKAKEAEARTNSKSTGLTTLAALKAKEAEIEAHRKARQAEYQAAYRATHRDLLKHKKKEKRRIHIISPGSTSTFAEGELFT